jgi:small ligand-binding sensory domain FIST
MLSGDFRVALAGRKAMDNDQIISTAGEGVSKALADLNGKASAVLAFNCAGRRGKLRRAEDELAAIQSAIGTELPLFGCYCAGEIGPLDVTEKPEGVLSGGGGWHVMFTAIGR